MSQIQGPGSDEQFAARCAEILLPALADQQITAAPWVGTDGSGYYLHGFHDNDDPSAAVSQVAERAGWTAQTLVLRAPSMTFGLPGGRTTDCEMPYNKHAIGKGETHKTCATGHKITSNHAVQNCPVCSQPLR